ncbi:unnamed protein product [Clavelina lepadiformis]|uniref:Protein kinase domain-containing protein n=1 Tax=Clavelina lepadiformis TaxID=159417 RepID=A0ABP0GLG6_CLALP
MNISEVSCKWRVFKPDEIFCNIRNNSLGEGSFGTVKLGFHKKLGRLAVKFSKRNIPARELNEERQKILEEADTMKQGRHDHVVEVLGLIDTEKIIAIVMEHMPAGSFHDLIDKKEAFKVPLPLLLQMVFEISDGITYLHNLHFKYRIAHGDLKPQNILLSSDLHCKIADFGGAEFSHHTLLALNMSDVTEHDFQFTKLFSAPELFTNGRGRLSTAMDVYSFGVILLFAIVGKYPDQVEMFKDLLPCQLQFDNITVEECLNKYKDQLKSEENQESYDILSMLEEVMTECVAQNPIDRPAIKILRSKLEERWRMVDPNTIKQHVIDVKETQVRMRDDMLDENSSTTLAEILQGEDSLQVNQAVSSISKDLESKNVYQTISQCDRLISIIESAYIADNKLVEITDDILDLIEMIQKRYCLKRTELTGCSESLVKLLQITEKFCTDVSRSETKIDLLRRWLQTADAFLRQNSLDDNVRVGVVGQILLSVDNCLSVLNSDARHDAFTLQTKIAGWKTKASCNRQLNNRKREQELNLEAVNELEDKFKDDYKKLGSLYAACCNNLGTNYFDTGELIQAELFYAKACHTHMGTDDYETEEIRMENLHITIENMCRLYENNPDINWKKEKDVLQSLAKPPDLKEPKLFTLMNRLTVLRLAISLQLHDDVATLCDEVSELSGIFSSSPMYCRWLSLKCNQIARILVKSKQDDLALIMLKCAMSFAKSISNPVDKIEALYRVSKVINERILGRFHEREEQNETRHIYAPMCHSAIALMEKCEVKKHSEEEEIKEECLRFANGHMSWCYLKAEDYNACIFTATKSLRGFPSEQTDCSGTSKKAGDFHRAHMNYCLGICHYKIKEFLDATIAFKESISFWKQYENTEKDIKKANSYILKINAAGLTTQQVKAK